MQAYEREQMQHERVYRAAGARAYQDAPPTQDPISVRGCSAPTYHSSWCSVTEQETFPSTNVLNLQSNGSV